MRDDDMKRFFVGKSIFMIHHSNVFCACEYLYRCEEVTTQ